MAEDIDQLQIDPQQIINELESFRESVRCLSSNEPRFIEEYPEQWVAICSGSVRAHGPTISVSAGKVGFGGVST